MVSTTCDRLFNTLNKEFEKTLIVRIHFLSNILLLFEHFIREVTLSLKNIIREVTLQANEL